jgi:hypothetical protein
VLVGRILVIVTVFALSWWYFDSQRRPSADRNYWMVTSLGWIGMAMTVAASALSVRKRLLYRGPGRMASWLGLHSYVGVVAMFAIAYHSGFRMGGPLTASLLVFFAVAAVSGIVGLRISRSVPPLLTAMEEKPALMEELLRVRGECMRGVLELARGGSDGFRFLVEKRLVKETGSMVRMWRFYRNRSTLAKEFQQFLRELEPDMQYLKPLERQAFQRAAQYALHVNKMNAELVLQRLLRGWVALHMVCTAVLLALAFVHVFSVLYY